MAINKAMDEAQTVTWKQTATGYSASNGAVVEKKDGGKRWVLRFGGQEHQLPRKPTFDHVDALMKTLENAR